MRRCSSASPRSFIVLAGTAILLMLAASPAFAAAGDLDPTFGVGGRVTTDFTRYEDAVYAMALQRADGKIVTAGPSGLGGSNVRFALARYNSDGSLDPSFSGDGKLTSDLTRREDVPFGIAIQADGKMVVAGTSGYATFALARYNSDGSLDASFSGDGKLTTDFTRHEDFAFAIVIQADGKIVVTGDAGVGGRSETFALARYKPNGSLDATFGGDGKVTTDFTAYPDDGNALAITTNGKIVVAGGAGFGDPNEKFALARYNPNGSLDVTFGGDGKVTTNFSMHPDVAFALALQTDGRIVVAGGSSLGTRFNPEFALARYKPDGSLDTSFGGDGRVITDFTPYDDGAYGMAIQADGRIVTAGLSGNDGANPKFALARYRSGGALDTSFGGDGKVTTDFTAEFDSAFSVGIQANGKIVAAGLSGGSKPQFALARYRAA
jgi:uncharacterized delta-60 repeat protein